MSKANLALVGFALLFVVYVAAGPYITVHKMRVAAEKRDGEALSEHIDFPSVRQSLKDQMNALFAKEMAEDEEMRDNPFAALGAVFAGVVVDRVVDAYVTPAGITLLMSGERPEIEEDRGTDIGDDRGPFRNASKSYESHDKFVVRIEAETGEETKFVLRRQGISWKLTDIVIPFE